jgi:hypothetical protein
MSPCVSAPSERPPACITTPRTSTNCWTRSPDPRSPFAHDRPAEYEAARRAGEKDGPDAVAQEVFAAIESATAEREP